MSNYNTTPLFYLQLKEDFFDEDAIDWIEEQPNGEKYSLFYLKLCLKSLKTNGILIRNVGELLIPYQDAVEVAKLTKTKDIDTVTVAMELLKKIGLIKILDNGAIYIPQIEKMVGKKTIGALKKEQQRQLANNKTQVLLEQDTEEEIKEEEPEEEKKEKKHKYGNYKNVLLTEKEYDMLLAEEDGEKAIEFLSEYIEMKGYKAKSHNLAIRKWVFTALKESLIREKELHEREERLNGSNKSVEKFKTHNYSKDEIKSLYSNLDDVKI